MSYNALMIVELNEIGKLSQKWESKKIGLITGSFDILHIGHISLFEYAKKHVDILLVGIDSNKSVEINKGKSRPYFDQNIRQQVVDAIRFVDYVFSVEHELKYTDPKLNHYFIELYQQLNVTHLITSKNRDNSYSEKEACALYLGIKVILQVQKKFNSSTSKIIKDLGL